MDSRVPQSAGPVSVTHPRQSAQDGLPLSGELQQKEADCSGAARPLYGAGVHQASSHTVQMLGQLRLYLCNIDAS